MPRHRRLHAPGALVHTVIRFINREYRIAGPVERAAVLSRLPSALARAGWILHAYAMMSSHLHIGSTAGEEPAERWLKPFLISLAYFLNAAHDRRGPVVMERAKTIVLPHTKMAKLASYLHNNPVRAGLVATAADSDWTSHRAWIGAAPVPPWLAVDVGLSAAGFDSTQAGRAGFDQWVRSRASEPRDPVLSGDALPGVRAKLRAATALPLEISSPALDDDGSEVAVFSCGAPCATPRWGGDIGDVVAAAAFHAGCTTEEVRSPSRRRAAVAARRVAVVAGVWLLRRRLNELAGALGISNGAASRLHRRGDLVLEMAHRVAAEVREGRWAGTGIVLAEAGSALP